MNAPAMMTVVPLVVQTASGRASDGGLVTAVTSAATVCAELSMPSLLGRFRAGRLFSIALALLCLGALGHLLVGAELPAVLALAIVRGVGFGTAVVVGAVLIAELAPPHARGRAVGNMGLVVGASSMIAPSLGLLLLANVGQPWVFAYAAAVAVLAIPFIDGVDRGVSRISTPTVHVHHGLRRANLVVPVLGLALLTSTYGGLVSFGPRILEPAGLGSAATFFLIYGGSRAITRWLGGRAADRFGAQRVALLGLVVALAGMLILALSLSPAAVVTSALTYGGGSGMAQSATFVGMLAHSSPGEVRLVGTLWNVAFDGGVSLGGALLGIVAGATGERSVLLALPLLTLVALLLLTLAWGRPGRRLAST